MAQFVMMGAVISIVDYLRVVCIEVMRSKGRLVIRRAYVFIR